MTTQPTITHTHTLDGSHTLPDWLHHDGHRLTLPGRDDDTRPQPGWMLVRWSDGHVTVASPQVAARAYGPDGMHGRLERAEAELAERDAADSADAAAGSYASGQAILTITVTGPNPVHAVRWAGHVRDLVHAEFGDSMGLHSFIELEPGGRVEPDFTGPLAGIEIRDPCPWCESSPVRIPRRLMAEHVATVHPEVRTGAPGIPVADAESVIVCTTACDEQHLYDWTCAQFAGIAAEPEPTTPEARAEETITRVTGLYEQWVKAGPPPLGTSMSRWWDRRLVEFHAALNPTEGQP